jgi:hypothetical protein
MNVKDRIRIFTSSQYLTVSEFERSIDVSNGFTLFPRQLFYRRLPQPGTIHITGCVTRGQLLLANWMYPILLLI